MKEKNKWGKFTVKPGWMGDDLPGFRERKEPRSLKENIARSLVQKYGKEHAEVVATNKALGAMTDEEQSHWYGVAAAVRGVQDVV